MQAMILAAGLGTRLKPFTNNHPKALATVNGKTLLQRNVEYLQKYNINNVVINVHHFASQIKDVVKQNNGWGSQIIISNETYEVLETGGGLKFAAPLLFNANNSPFVLLNVDILTNLNISAMLAQHKAMQPLATLAVTNRVTSRYLLFNNTDALCGWQNESTGEQKGLPGQKKAFSGIHIISPTIFNKITEEGKFSLIDVYLRLAPTNHIQAYNHNNDVLVDVGKPESIIKAESLFE